MAERARTTGQPIFFQERLATDGLASTALLLLQTEGATLGALFLGSSQPGVFKPSQIELMKAIASQIALAVRNAQLYTQLRQSAVLEERFRLSREMHDGVAQTLGYLGMQAERLEQLVERGDTTLLPQELKELRRVIADAYLDVRETIDGLRLTVDQPGGFVGALQTHVEDFTRRTGLPVDCSCVETPPNLPPDVALHLLRITQEALTNVRRHAGAHHVWVSLARENGSLELTVSDDGQGFDPGSPLDRQHVGLSSMRERVRSLDGQLTLATSPGQGTRITARVPMPKN
jgi:signal transduction histidine kinase